MISCPSGEWILQGGRETKRGKWTYRDGKVFSESEGGKEEQVGTPSFDPIGDDPLPDVLQKPGNEDLPVIKVLASEIMKEIQKPENEGAYFVLPSQLNGAEYPSHTSIIKRIEDYKFDNTGGPRGQLAVHPAAGQFILANAASDENPNGINAIDEILEQLSDTGFKLKNGYMKIDPAKSPGALQKFKGHLHTLRPLIMKDVIANGLLPSKGGWSDGQHAVNLVYASAVPVDAYLNSGTTDFDLDVAELVLIAQYYGSLKFAADHSPPGTKIFLMPLGGGVFSNPWPRIASGMARAVEMLDPSQRSKLDITVLTWEGSPREESTMTSELANLRKLSSKM
eukprot:TRINITY_DN41773_c0_g1_i1.p1 TRINITY_DN41773_c0_g1~~TRINITY_DN41773_c0_g1_i1.p1  ORF type:complete len:376 (+),score=66.34 TRINITY_DN41773_c0_g1_i1:116-1129(+)